MDKYKPETISDLCANPKHASDLVKWLRNWRSIHLHSGPRKGKLQPGQEKVRGRVFKLLRAHAPGEVPKEHKLSCVRDHENEHSYDRSQSKTFFAWFMGLGGTAGRPPWSRENLARTCSESLAIILRDLYFSIARIPNAGNVLSDWSA